MKPTPKPTPKPTLNPNWSVTAIVHDAVLNSAYGTDVDTVTWRVTSAADGARCILYLSFVKDGQGQGNVTVGGMTYHKGGSNSWVSALPPDQHGEIANYTLSCALNGGTKHWADPGTINVE